MALWATGKEAGELAGPKGSQVPIRELYWNVSTLSAATLVSYRRPGQRRGSPHQAILPGDVLSGPAARALGRCWAWSRTYVSSRCWPGQVTRPASAVPSPVLVPEPEEAGTIPEPAPGQVRDHSPLQVPSPFEPEAPQRGSSKRYQQASILIGVSSCYRIGPRASAVYYVMLPRAMCSTGQTNPPLRDLSTSVRNRKVWMPQCADRTLRPGTGPPCEPQS